MDYRLIHRHGGSIRFLAALLGVLLHPSGAWAVPAVIPGDFPTIQQALDAGRDSILVKDGVPPERLTVSHSVALEPFVASSPPGWVDAPVIRSMEIIDLTTFGSKVSVRCTGLRFLGEVSTELCSLTTRFEACRLDSGFTAPCGSFGYEQQHLMRGCLIFASVDLAGQVQFINNTVIGGTLHVSSYGSHEIRGNYFQGPAAAGIELEENSALGSVSQNTIRGTIEGIRILKCNGETQVYENDIADCSGNGIIYFFDGSFFAEVVCSFNLIQRCGGGGIATYGDSHLPPQGFLRGNVIRDVGTDGMALDSVVTWVMRENTVLDAGGRGIAVATADSFVNNVVGRCGGVGVRVTREVYRIFSNTVFSNHGAGFQIAGTFTDWDGIKNNIAAYNSGPGLLYDGTGAPRLVCNDWFANPGGAVIGLPIGDSDLQLDPLFCNLSLADVRLAANSVLRTGGGCGLVGALGQGCAATTAEVTTGRSTISFRAWPVPAHGPVAFELPFSSEAATLEVFDIAGARRWRGGVSAGMRQLVWDRRDGEGRHVAPGVYFARLSGMGSIPTVRIVLAD